MYSVPFPNVELLKPIKLTLFILYFDQKCLYYATFLILHFCLCLIFHISQGSLKDGQKRKLKEEIVNCKSFSQDEGDQTNCTFVNVETGPEI